MLQDHIIVGVHITDRVKHAVEVQNILTEYGCHIKTRLGLHELAEGDSCSPSGLVIVEFVGSKACCDDFCARIRAVEGVGVQAMTFGHP